MNAIIKSKKIIYFTFFIFFLLFLILLYERTSYFPNSYTHTEWLIHYREGFIRRGFLGKIILFIGDVSNINLKYIIFIFQITAYSIYLLLLFKFINKFKSNFFIISIVLFPLFIIYPLYETEAIGRKDIFFILSFQLYILICNKFSKFKSFFFLVLILILNFLIHEAIIFYIFFFFNIFILRYEIKKKEICYYLFTIIFISIMLIFIALKYHSSSAIISMVSYLSINYGLSIGSGALSWLNREIIDQIVFYNFNFKFFHVFQFLMIFLISTIPISYYLVNIFKKINSTQFIISSIINFVLLISLISITLDWYRFLYIYFNLFLLTIFYLVKFDETFFENLFFNLKKFFKAKKLLYFFIILYFYSWTPKLLFSDDFGSIPLLRIFNKLF